MTKESLFSIVVEEPDIKVRKLSGKKWDSIAKPIDGLGNFEDIISRMAAVFRKTDFDLKKKALIIMCADNGVFEEGVSQTSQRVTRDVAELMGDRRSSVGIMCGNYNIDSFVYDIGINSDDTPEGVIDAKIRKGTANFLKQPAMTEEECLKAVKTGIDAVRKCAELGYSIIATGEMGIANTTTSTAVLSALKGLDPRSFTGRGAGLSDSGLENKIKVIEKGLTLYRGDKSSEAVTDKEEVLEILCCLGGLDIAGLAGVFIGGAMYHIPIVIDGVISAVAALIAERLVPGVREYMFASHMGREKGMELILKELSLKPVIHADLALGEGTGAVMLLPMLDMAMSLYNNGTSFGDTEIDQYERFDV